MNLVGLLPRLRLGHRWLLNMQDRFTKWFEMRPLRRATARSITEHLTEAVILRHGSPKEILTDNGANLHSQALADRLHECGIQHRFTSPYAPHCNPVEHTNRTVKTIAQYTGKNQRMWNERLPELQFAASHDATGYSPAFLNHGRELARPGERGARHGRRRTHGIAVSAAGCVA